MIIIYIFRKYQKLFTTPININFIIGKNNKKEEQRN